MRELKKAGDSIGAKITVVAENIPVGLGEPVFDRLDADLAHALMSINAVKGWKLAMVLLSSLSVAVKTAMKLLRKASKVIMPAAF